MDYTRGLLGSGIQFQNPASRTRLRESFQSMTRGPYGPRSKGRSESRVQDSGNETMTSAKPTLEIRDLHVAVEGKPILKGLSSP